MNAYKNIFVTTGMMICLSFTAPAEADEQNSVSPLVPADMGSHTENAVSKPPETNPQPQADGGTIAPQFMSADTVPHVEKMENTLPSQTAGSQPQSQTPPQQPQTNEQGYIVPQFLPADTEPHVGAMLRGLFETTPPPQNYQNFIAKLVPGTKVKITVYNEPDLSGTFEVDNTGILTIPLLGSSQVAGLDPRELETLLTDKLQSGYLINPKVNVEVLNFKPIFILGEVNKPGSYPYVTDLTVFNAVAEGGGFTYRARTSYVDIIRQQDGKKVEIEGTSDTPVYPGDTIRVEERLF